MLNNPFIHRLIIKGHELMYRFWVFAVDALYGDTIAIPVMVFANEGVLDFITPYTEGTLPRLNTEADTLSSRIRAQATDNMMHVSGLPKNNPYHTILIPTPSLLVALGPVEFAKFCKAWPGDTKLGEKIVCYHSIMR
jgi:hypothetical protein